MYDIEPQTADGKVLWHFTMSLDGFVAWPNHEMDWMTGFSSRPRLYWQLPGPASHRLATTSFRPSHGRWTTTS